MSIGDLVKRNYYNCDDRARDHSIGLIIYIKEAAGYDHEDELSEISDGWDMIWILWPDGMIEKEFHVDLVVA